MLICKANWSNLVHLHLCKGRYRKGTTKLEEKDVNIFQEWIALTFYHASSVAE